MPGSPRLPINLTPVPRCARLCPLPTHGEGETGRRPGGGEVSAAVATTRRKHLRTQGAAG
ncbi:MAG: hypothetical protein Kow00124_24090 [Anaerolineae bacterium]